MSFYFGIDPGIKGAVSFLDDSSGQIFAFRLPVTKDKEIDGGRLKKLFDKFPCEYGVLEKVGAMPRQGVTSMFSFGKTYGILMGCLQIVGVPFDRATPQTWQKFFKLIKPGEGRSKKDRKRQIKEFGQDILTIESERSVPQDVIESSLLAVYAYKTFVKSDAFERFYLIYKKVPTT